MFGSEYADVPPVEPPIHEAVLGRAAEFGEHPALIDADRWPHTGDVGHVDEAGRLFVVDRVKELIEYQGCQVAPAELQALLLTHPGIDDAAVGARNDDGDEIPHAFAVRRPTTGDLTENEITPYVAERVAPCERVRKVTFLGTVPRATSGRILRRQLREHP